MFKTCSDPDFNWMHCLCDEATWVVKEPGKPIGFFYSRLFDDALSPSGLGFAVDAFRIDEDGTLDDFYSDILWDYGAADELIAAYPNKFSCAVRCDGLNPYDIPTSWSQDKGERYRARDTVLAAVDMLTDEADEAGIDIPVRLVKPDGTPFAEGVATVSWDSITGKPATFTPPAPTASARGGVLQQAAEAQLAASADSAAIIAKVNATLTKLKAAGILA